MDIRKTQRKDLYHVALNLREMDKKECGYTHPIQASSDMLKATLEEGSVTLTAFNDKDIPVAIFGVRPHKLLAETGVVWLLMTDEFLNHKKSLLELPRKYLPHMLNLYPTLINSIYKHNYKVIDWLLYLGFTFQKTTDGTNRETNEEHIVFMLRKEDYNSV